MQDIPPCSNEENAPIKLYGINSHPTMRHMYMGSINAKANPVIVPFVLGCDKESKFKITPYTHSIAHS